MCLQYFTNLQHDRSAYVGVTYPRSRSGKIPARSQIGRVRKPSQPIRLLLYQHGAGFSPGFLLDKWMLKHKKVKIRLKKIDVARMTRKKWHPHIPMVHRHEPGNHHQNPGRIPLHVPLRTTPQAHLSTAKMLLVILWQLVSLILNIQYNQPGILPIWNWTGPNQNMI